MIVSQYLVSLCLGAKRISSTLSAGRGSNRRNDEVDATGDSVVAKAGMDVFHGRWGSMKKRHRWTLAAAGR